MDGLLELGGVWLARAYAFYGIVFLGLPFVTFGSVAFLAAVVWMAVSHARERRPWPFLPGFVRRWGRLAVEVSFGLVNPIIYLVILTPSLPAMRVDQGGWWATFVSVAWVLLGAFWTLRLTGGVVGLRSLAARVGVRALLVAAIACVLAFGIRDLLILTGLPDIQSIDAAALIVLRVCPFYLVPVVLLLDHLRATLVRADVVSAAHGLFLLPDRAARGVVAVAVVVAMVSVGLAAYRRSDEAVQALVRDHRDAIQAAAARYDVDPRLIASIVYVTHRDQLSPFRQALERFVMSAWTGGRMDEIGANETLLNRPFDVSVGLAQIKPRTAQTATLLAAGLVASDLPQPASFDYWDSEPAGQAWPRRVQRFAHVAPPFPLPAKRQVIVDALLDARSNLETCALILALYQHQWEAANPAWSLRDRPEILATLYQIGFARSTPHGAPRSNAFGRRVREVYSQLGVFSPPAAVSVSPAALSDRRAAP